MKQIIRDNLPQIVVALGFASGMFQQIALKYQSEGMTILGFSLLFIGMYLASKLSYRK